MHPIQSVLLKKNKEKSNGVYSCCSANKLVLRAAMNNAKKNNYKLLIEATANQVDQYGGYTGLTPKDFSRFVFNLASECNFPHKQLVLGGDHLGPLTFAHLGEREAMDRARELVKQYVLAGFSKIHIDTSMLMGDDDKSSQLSPDKIAARAVNLCSHCEQAFLELKKSHCDVETPIYVIGSEVPIPGGAQENENSISITTMKAAKETIATFEEYFRKNNLETAFERVVALVVQPGVEFSDNNVFEYSRRNTRNLCNALKGTSLVFEAHSTDYQSRYKLKEMVEDGFGILKVGPALTFAMREALFALDSIEKELSLVYSFEKANMRNILENVMCANPKSWQSHYRGSSEEKKFARAFSYSDRSRYYWNNPTVVNAIKKLILNLEGCQIPLTLISQYMPLQYIAVRNGEIKCDPLSLIQNRIENCIDDYVYACQ